MIFANCVKKRIEVTCVDGGKKIFTLKKVVKNFIINNFNCKYILN